MKLVTFPRRILFAGTKLAGLVDVGRAGLADRYQALALLGESLKNAELIKNSLSATTYTCHEKLKFYALLDERCDELVIAGAL